MSNRLASEVTDRLRNLCKDPSIELICLEAEPGFKNLWFIDFSPSHSKSGLRLGGAGNSREDVLKNMSNAIDLWEKNNLF